MKQFLLGAALPALFLTLFIQGAAAGPSDAINTLILSRPDIRFVLFGEMHGTKEEPQIFGDVVEAMTRQHRPVVAALELEPGTLDSWLASDGGTKARQKLMAQDDFNSGDGRGSRAMFALIYRLKTLSQNNKNLNVAVIKPAQAGGTSYEKTMAANIQAAGKGGALVLVLVGNAHNMRVPLPSEPGYPGYDPMAMHMPATETLSIGFVTAGGDAWNCQATCGIHPLRADPVPPGQQLIVLKQPHQPYDVLLPVGKVSASPPMSKSTP